MNKMWVTASSIRNYILNDPLVDWLEFMKTRGGEYQPDEYSSLESLFKDGILFEENILKHLKTTYGEENIKTVAETSQDFYNSEKFELTKRYISEKIPIIYQAVLVDDEKKIGGIADLIIRSDFFNKILSDNNATHYVNDKEIFYVVIDIKCSRLALKTDGVHLQNSKHYPFYKGQLHVYNQTLAKIQGYDPKSAYILGRGWEYTRGGAKIFGVNCFERLGKVDYNGEDSFIIPRVEEAISWVRKVRTEAESWTLFPPTLLELRPNLVIDAGKWQKSKKDIAAKQMDVTLLHSCGHAKRKLADDAGVTNWKDCKADDIGIKSEKRKKTVNRSIKVNKAENFEIMPKKFSKACNEMLKKASLELYIDYETFYMKSPDIDMTNIDRGKVIVFMVGCGFVGEDNIWKFKNFVLENKEDCQKELFKKVLDEIGTDVDYKIFSWGTTEKNLYEKVTGDFSFFSESKYTDLLKFFRDESISISGSFKYSLKEIVRAMHSGGCISTIWPDGNEITNGFNAMKAGEKFYEMESGDEKENILQFIKIYNEVDCKVMYEIVNYFRTR